MSARNILFLCAVLAILLNVAITILIMAWLDRRGHKTNILLARVFMFKYLAAYKEATHRETGRTGRLYGLWLLTVNLAAALAVAGLLCPRG